MLKKSTLFWLTAVLVVFAHSKTRAQGCGTSVINEGGVAVGCGAFGTSSNISSTAYRTFTVVNGVNYSISTCGTGWDSQVTIRDNSDGYKTYNDDNGPSCSGTAASVDWMADYSGTARAYVHRYNCGNAWPGTSAVLQIRQNSTVTNTTNTGTICEYQTKALTAAVSSGTATPTWSVVSGGGSIFGTTYTPPNVAVNTTVTVRATLGVCSSDISFVVTAVPTTPAPGTAGNGTWNIYGYAAGDAGGGGGAWATNYSGFYTDNALNFNTGTRWTNSPSEANGTGGSAYSGCAIPADNHSWRAVRTNIACGTYQLQVTHDDIGQILINGVTVYNNPACCASTNAGTFVISPSDVIEYRVSEGGGGSNGLITFNNAAIPLDAGTITYSGSTSVCGSYDPPAFGNSAAASGGASAAYTGVGGQGAGTSTYQWQVNGSDIGGASGLTYDPGVLTAGSYTYRRRVTDECGTVAYTNTFTIVVTATPSAASNTTSGAAICETSTKALTGTPGGGSWSVVSGGGSIAGTTYTPADVATATGVTVRYTIAAVGACPATTSDVTFTVDANPGTASNTTSNAAICESSTKALTGTPAGGTWSVISGGGSIAGTTYTPANVTSATNVTVRYSIAASGTCPGSTSDVTFTVDADPGTASNTTSNAAICESSTKALTATPAGGSWSVVSGGGSIAGTTYTPANVTSATNVTVRYSIAASGTCPGSTSDVTFTVDADPGTASNTTSNAAICESSTKALTATPAGGSWSVVSGGGSIAGTTYTPADVTSATSVTVRYSIAASGSCPGSTSDVTFTVDASPGTASNTTSNAAICESSTKALTGTPAGGSWSVVSGGGSIAGTTYTPANVTSATNVTVRYSIAASGTCPGSTSDVTFTVDADPGTASNTTSNAAICESSTKALTATPAGGSWSVVSGGGSIAGTTYTPANVASATSVTVRYTVAASGSCPGSSSDVTFTVDADPGTASNTTSNAAICESATKALTGTPAGGSWSVVSGGGSIAGTTYTPANITSSTSVTVRYSIAAGGACSGSTSDVTFTVDPIPAAFTPVVVTSMPLCFRGNARVEFTGEAGVQYQLRDNITNVNAPGNGPGTVPLHTDNLTANSNTYNVLASTGAGCTLNVAVPAITVSTTPTALANNNDSRTCYINGNNAYVEFFSANGSIMAINPGAQNLGDVTVTEYVGLPLGIQACGTSPTSEPQFNSATLGRHWTVSSTVAPTSNLNVRLYFGDVDVTALSLASLANVNPFDDLNTLADMELSKYSGANENGTFTDNCGNGTVTLHPQVGGGVMSAGNIGYTVSAAGYSVHTVSSFSEFWLSGTNNVSPLPIELTSFTATCVNGMVSLHWITASEINNEQFLVERSDNLQVWEQVAQLPGAGNSNQTLHYETVDERPLQGLSYYRLTQRDYDGKSETFAPVSVTCYSDGNGNTLMLYPNPATQEFKVAVTATHDAPGTLRITEANGKTVYQQNLNLVKGQNEFRVDAAALNPGTYVVHLKSENMEMKPVKVLIIK